MSIINNWFVGTMEEYEDYVTAVEDFNASDIANDEYVMSFDEWCRWREKEERLKG